MPQVAKNHLFPLFYKGLIDFEAFHFWPCEGSENGKLQKDSPQRQLQREVPNRPKITLSLHFNKVLIDFEAFHFWPCEGSENGKLKKVSPKGNYKENCLGWHKITTFSEEPNAFWPFCGNVGWQEKVSQGGS